MTWHLGCTYNLSASHNKVVGLQGDELKIAITPPTEGKANPHLSKSLSQQFKVAKRQVAPEKGELCRHKQVRVHSSTVIPQDIEALT